MVGVFWCFFGVFLCTFSAHAFSYMFHIAQTSFVSFFAHFLHTFWSEIWSKDSMFLIEILTAIWWHFVVRTLTLKPPLPIYTIIYKGSHVGGGEGEGVCYIFSHSVRAQFHVARQNDTCRFETHKTTTEGISVVTHWAMWNHIWPVYSPFFTKLCMDI